MPATWPSYDSKDNNNCLGSWWQRSSGDTPCRGWASKTRSDLSHLDSQSHQKMKKQCKTKETCFSCFFQAQAFCAKERVKNKEICTSCKLNTAQVETRTLVADQKAGIQPPCWAKALTVKKTSRSIDNVFEFLKTFWLIGDLVEVLL